MAERKDRMLSGYKVVYRPEHFSHTLNDKAYRGYVYEHRYIMEVKLGRALEKNEVVHHKDGNKLNNNINNLELTTRKEHSTKHTKRQHHKNCRICGGELAKYSKSDMCRSCANRLMRKVMDRPSKEELLKLLETNSYCAVGRMFGVSDNTIRKWLK